MQRVRRAILTLATLIFLSSLVYLQQSQHGPAGGSAPRRKVDLIFGAAHNGFLKPSKNDKSWNHNEPSTGIMSAFIKGFAKEFPKFNHSKGVVMGKLKDDKFDTDWLHELEDWKNFVYIVDLEPGANSPTGYRTKINRAHEAMPYLTYIVEHYPDFPDVVAFVHPHRGGFGSRGSAWHTDAPQNDAVSMLRMLRTDTVVNQGYVNLRCTDFPGCPGEIQPWRQPPNPEKSAEHVFPYFYASMFNMTLPEVKERASIVAQACCAQFAVARQQILARPKAEYEHVSTTKDHDPSLKIEVTRMVVTTPLEHIC